MRRSSGKGALGAASKAVRPSVFRRWARRVALLVAGLTGLLLLAGLTALLGRWAFLSDGWQHPDVHAGHDGTIRVLAFSPDGRWLATAAGGRFKTFAWPTHAPRGDWGAYGRATLSAAPMTLAFAPDGESMVYAVNPEAPPQTSGIGDEPRPGQVVVAQAPGGETIQILIEDGRHTDSVAFGEGGRHVFAARNLWDKTFRQGRGGELVKWTVGAHGAGEILFAESNGAIFSLSAVAKIRKLIFARTRAQPSSDQALPVTEVVLATEGGAVDTVIGVDGPARLKAVVPSQDGRLLVLSFLESSRLAVYDTQGKHLRDIDVGGGATAWQGGGAFIGQSHRFVYPTHESGHGDGMLAPFTETVGIFDLDSGNRTAALDLRSTIDDFSWGVMASSPDGMVLAVGFGDRYEGDAAFLPLTEEAP